MSESSTPVVIKQKETPPLTLDHFINQSSSYESNSCLFSLILGTRGAGKSTIIGTLAPHGKIFHITSDMEFHSVDSSKIYGGKNIIPIFYDLDDEKNLLSSELSLLKLDSILSALIKEPNLNEKICAVSFDSFSSFERIILNLKSILNHENGFFVLNYLDYQYFLLMQKLRKIHRKGVHIITTMPLMASVDEDGLYHDASPLIRGRKILLNAVGYFPEILPIIQVKNGYGFQMKLKILKKPDKKEEQNEVCHFSPRVGGVSDDILVSINSNKILPADLSYIYQLKLKCEESKNQEELNEAE